MIRFDIWRMCVGYSVKVRRAGGGTRRKCAMAAVPVYKLPPNATAAIFMASHNIP